MRKNFIFFAMTILMLTGCGITQEEYNAAVSEANDYKTKYESLAIEKETTEAELNALKSEVEDLNNKISECEKYDSIITALNSDNYDEAIKQIVEMQPTDSNKQEVEVTDNKQDNSNEKEVSDDKNETTSTKDDAVTASYVGIWVSQKDSNQQIRLESGGLAYIGDKQCTWKIASNGYGPYGILVYVDNGAGRYEFLMQENPNELVSNSVTANMPQYLDFSEIVTYKRQ